MSSSYGVCADCGGPARAIPGASYGPEDVELFNQLSAALAEGGVDAPMAARLQAELDATPPTAPGIRLALLCKSLPSLVELMAGRQDPGSVRKAESIAMALLEALAAGRGDAAGSFDAETPTDDA